MKEVPRPVIILALLLTVALFGYLLWHVQRGDVVKPYDQYLDQLDIEADKPQPAGQNITP